jgi:hypothetical protein
MARKICSQLSKFGRMPIVCDTRLTLVKDRSRELFETKVEVHDRKQFELKLEYQPSGTDPDTRYFVETTLFIPRSLNVTTDTWPRDSFYADLHNYVRLKTPILSFPEILTGAHSPLIQMEERIALGLMGPESEVVYDAKMLACVLRAALRKFSREMRQECRAIGKAAQPNDAQSKTLKDLSEHSTKSTVELLSRFRALRPTLCQKYNLSDRTKASLRLVDEYMSLLVEQYFRRVVVQMEAMPKTPAFSDVRRALMDFVVTEETYRKGQKMTSVISTNTDNEEYSHRLSFLKKFCMNILFLEVQRSSPQRKWEEVLFAVAAGGAMAFALGVGLFAQSRYPQASFNFFLLAVIGYMVKDRIKEALRRTMANYAGKFLYERTTRIIDPVTHEEVGVCKEKVDYGVEVSPDILALRAKDDLVTAAAGELSETVVRYRKKIALESDMLPRIADGLVTGVTDIIRLNVEHLLHDMDDPEHALDYVDLDDFSVETLKIAKSYRIDVAFRFAVDDGKTQRTSVRLMRLVMDRNGIKRMTELVPETVLNSSERELVGTQHPAVSMPPT